MINKHAFFVVSSILFLMFILQSVDAQSKPSARIVSLIAHLVAEAKQPDSHSGGDLYLSVTLAKVEYIASLRSGKVVSQRKAQPPDGGICGDYAEVAINLLDKDKKETAQGSGQVLKNSAGKWKRIALSEGDYNCEDLKKIPRLVRKCLKTECS